MASEFTATQAKIFDVLSDGCTHRREELRECLDELAEFATINVHLTAIRKKLRTHGEDILCERVDGKISYRRVRLVGPSRQC